MAREIPGHPHSHIFFRLGAYPARYEKPMRNARIKFVSKRKMQEISRTT
jgi:hypothetical protein